MTRTKSALWKLVQSVRHTLAAVGAAFLLLLIPSSGCTDCDCYDEVCFDGVDNDGDGFADCNDIEDCAFFCTFGDVPGGTVTEVNCSDGIDNDNDGLTDCADPNCSVIPPCLQSSTFLENCGNNVDDNANGLVDCHDFFCAFDQSCRNTFCPALTEDTCLTPGGLFAYTSNAAYPRRGETLRLDSAAQLSGITFWGVVTGEATVQLVIEYLAGLPSSVGPQTLPGLVIGSFSQTAATLTVNATPIAPATSLTVDDDGDGAGPSYPLIQFDATHAPIALQANICYVVVIHDEANQFAWAGAVEYDGTSSIKVSETAAWQTAPAGIASDLTICPILEPIARRGACCYTSIGMCYDDIAAEDCAVAGRIYRGDGSLCATSPPCNQATGACCIGGGDCVISTQGGCDGFYRGDGTTCPPNPPCP